MPFPDYDALRLKNLIVKLDTGSHIAIVVLNRAKQRNTFADGVEPEIIKVFELFDIDDRVRIVIFTAEHTAPAFCSGAALTGSWDSLVKEEGDKEHRDPAGQVTLSILNCRKLTIIAVNGHAVGIGMTMQLAFDLRFVWKGAKLAFPFVRLGVSPEAMSTYLLPRLLGHSKASSLLLTGETVQPDNPQLAGLYHKTLETREEVFPAALAYAKELAEKTSMLAVAYTKGLLAHPGSSAEENHLLESRVFYALATGKDGADGQKAFLESRNPKFVATLSDDLAPWYPWWTSNVVDVRYRKSKL